MGQEHAGVNADDLQKQGGPGLPPGTESYMITGQDQPCSYIRRGPHGTFYYLLPDGSWKEDKPPKGILIAAAQTICEHAANPVVVMLTIAAVSLGYSIKIAHQVGVNPSTLLARATQLIASSPTNTTDLVLRDLAGLERYVDSSKNCQIAQSIVLMAALWLNALLSSVDKISNNWTALTTGGCKQSTVSVMSFGFLASGILNMAAALYQAIRQNDATDWLKLRGNLHIDDPMFRVIFLMTLAAFSLYFSGTAANFAGSIANEQAEARINQSIQSRMYEAFHSAQNAMSHYASQTYTQWQLFGENNPARRYELFKTQHEQQAAYDNKAASVVIPDERSGLINA